MSDVQVPALRLPTRPAEAVVLAPWQANAIWRLDRVRSGIAALLRPITRDPHQVADEYDDGHWSSIAKQAAWRNAPSLAAFLRPDAKDARLALMDGQLVSISTIDYYRWRAEALRTVIGELLGDQTELVEIGAGTGHNLFTLSEAPCPWARLLGLDISPTGISVVKDIASHFSIASVDADALDLGDARHHGWQLVRARNVFTHYCMEQLADRLDQAVENLIAAGPRRVVHIETLSELMDPSSARDRATRAWVRRMDYQTRLLTILRRHEAQGRITITRVERLNYAPTPRYDACLVSWESRPA